MASLFCGALVTLLAETQAAVLEKSEKDGTEASLQKMQEQERELERLRLRLAQQEKEIERLSQEVVRLQREVEREALRLQRERELQYEEQLKRIQKVIEELEQIKKERWEPEQPRQWIPEPPASNAPPVDVVGRVKQVDKSGLVLISIGSNDSLQRGQTLDLYRLVPRPQYLGQLRLIDVRSTEAVGRPVRKIRVPIEVGDRVAADLSK
jgi:hypothetical protein